jgi:hypothetical protein
VIGPMELVCPCLPKLVRIAVAALAAVVVSGVAARADDPSTRNAEPVIVGGSSLANLAGKTASQLGVFVYSAATGGFTPIPFQLDERVNQAFSYGGIYQFTQLIYDIAHTENGQLDDDDEIAFMYKDAGATRAPDAATWPTGSDTRMYEIQVTDPRTTPNPPRWAYVFSGTGMATSSTAYVTWNTTYTGPVQSSHFEVNYTGRWQLSAFRVPAPCGSGADMLDRLKGRASPLPGVEESEDNWNSVSSYLGGIVGPIRAIRYVRGASSGVNTIHFDVIYENMWLREFDLRVHALNSARIYFDWLPGSSESLYLPSVTNGFAVDGVADTGYATTVPAWTVFRSPRGGMALSFDLPASTLVGSSRIYYRDDSTYNDKVATASSYGDDDDSAYGDVGIEILSTSDSTITPIVMRFKGYPLCANEGSAAIGNAVQQLAAAPLAVAATERARPISPVRSLAASASGSDVVLTWQAVAGADTYRVYQSAAADADHSAWTMLISTSALTYTVGGGAPGAMLRCWSVVPVAAGTEGGW